MVDLPEDTESPAGYDDGGQREAILQNLYSGSISVQDAAERLATLSLGRTTSKTEEGLHHTAYVVLEHAKGSDEHHESLAEMMASMASLPPVLDHNGEQVLIWGVRLWDDLPIFGADQYDDWRYNGGDSQPDEDGEVDTQVAIDAFVNLNKFMAWQVVKQHSDMDTIPIYLLRPLLESHEIGSRHEPPNYYFPAALAWLSVAGSEIYSWDVEIPYGGNIGDPGRGGPLWDGKHGYCKERWSLWRRRFTEVSESSALSEDSRETAKQCAAKMRGVEDRAVL